ncbi:MAG: dienelactone hydrolase family protein [Candidatus Binataceae bacterium]
METQQILTDSVRFQVPAGEITGYLAHPAAPGSYPALIVAHEMWGLTEHVCDVTRRFAREGYFAIAPDMYSRLGHPIVPTGEKDRAFRLMDELKIADGIDDLLATMRWIKDQPGANRSPIGITGFCMGGTYSIELACATDDLKAAAPFYGQVAPDERLAALKCPVLYIGAELDYWAPVEQAQRLNAALKRYGKPGEVVIYKNVPHAFFNDARPEVYHEAEAKAAWNKTLEFLNRYLKR